MNPPDCKHLKALALLVLLCVVPASAPATPPTETEVLDLYLKVFPDTKSIGVIYSEEKNEQSVRALEERGRELGIEVKSFKVSSIKEFSKALSYFKGLVDTIWVPDDGIYQSMEVWKYFVMFTMRHRIRSIVHSEKSLAMGGLFFSPEENEILINKRVLDMLGLEVPDGVPVKYHGEG